MNPLRPEDFFSWPDYEQVRTVTRRRLLDYIKTQRTLCFPSGTELVFDNRQTLWFRMQEIIWVGKLYPQKDSLIELEAINRMLCLWGEMEAHLAPVNQGSLSEPDPWPEEISLAFATRPVVALKADFLRGNHLTSGWDQGIRFRWTLADAEQSLFYQTNLSVEFRLTRREVRETSEPLPLKVRRSLLGDWETANPSSKSAP